MSECFEELNLKRSSFTFDSGPAVMGTVLSDTVVNISLFAGVKQPWYRFGIEATEDRFKKMVIEFSDVSSLVLNESWGMFDSKVDANPCSNEGAGPAKRYLITEVLMAKKFRLLFLDSKNRKLKISSEAKGSFDAQMGISTEISSVFALIEKLQKPVVIAVSVDTPPPHPRPSCWKKGDRSCKGSSLVECKEAGWETVKDCGCEQLCKTSGCEPRYETMKVPYSKNETLNFDAHKKTSFEHFQIPSAQVGDRVTLGKASGEVCYDGSGKECFGVEGEPVSKDKTFCGTTGYYHDFVFSRPGWLNEAVRTAVGKSFDIATEADKSIKLCANDDNNASDNYGVYSLLINVAGKRDSTLDRCQAPK